MKNVIKIFFLCFLILAGLSFAQAKENKTIRVLILDNVSEADLFIKGRYEIRSLADNKPSNTVLGKGRKGIHKKFRLKGGFLNMASVKTDAVIIIPARGVFYLNNRPLKGSLVVKKNKAFKLSAINYVNIEDYVKGVLFQEVSHRWPIEALKAQAVATRTYALYYARINKDRDYDVSSDMYSQVYGGKDSERYRTNKAVRLTRGLALFYDGKIFPAFFHATCAGKTEDADELWDINLPCLKSVDCGFCVGSPHFKWAKTLEFKEIIDKLNAAGYNLKSLEDVQIIERNNSGRVRALSLTSGAKKTIMPGKDFRLIMGPKEIRSLNFKMEVNDTAVNFFGFGWGHGVGMCQWGAYFMSKRGYKYQSILQFYYPGAKIGEI